MTCEFVPEIRYSEFNDRLRLKTIQERIPVAGSMELGFRCNLRCQQCYVSHGHQGIPGMAELRLDEIHRILDEVVDAGCLWFTLTGGEPLLRRDFTDIYLYAKRKGLILTLYTNGTRLTARLADLLAEWRPFVVEISLYGYTQATYERVTGIPGSHARCMQGIELIIERGIPLRLKTVLMTLNRAELAEMQAFADRLGVDFRYDPLVTAGLQNRESGLPLRLSAEETVWYDMHDPKRWELLTGLYVKEANHGYRAGKANYLYKCMAGLNSFHIDPYGRLSRCVLEREPSVDLRQVPFAEGWKNVIMRTVDEEFPPDVLCSQCAMRKICAQCTAWGLLETGDRAKRVPFICQVTQTRARAVGVMV